MALALAGCGNSQTNSPPATSTVPSDIQAIFNKPMYAKATWGLRVLDGKKVLIDSNSQRQFFIGSVRKIFSVGQLMDTVGPTHTYDTPVYHDGTVTDGVLNGNLIVVASGDLTMGGRTNPDGTIAYTRVDHSYADALGSANLTAPDPLAGYKQLARQINAAGINRINGDVVVDDRLFAPFLFRKEFYVTPIFVNDDFVDLTIVPAKTSMTWRPTSAALNVNDRLRPGAPGSENTLAINPPAPACIGTPGCTATISGSLPTGFKPPFTGVPLVQTVTIAKPANYARTVLVEALEAAGTHVAAPAVEANPVNLLPPQGSYQPGAKVAQLTGLPYAQDAKLILKTSYNIGADTSLVLLGVANHLKTMAGALQFEQRNLAARYGVSPAGYHFVDGSGGGETTATNAAVTQMLTAIAAGPSYPAFYAALPILGVDTSSAFKSDPTLAGAARMVHAKGGTYIAGVNGRVVLRGEARGGYVTTKSGRHLVFYVVVNDVPISALSDQVNVSQDQDRIAAILWRDY